MKITICQPVGFTEMGGRTNNEDSLYPAIDRVSADDRLFLVCDGVGGQHKGEVASALACKAMAEFYQQNPVDVMDEPYIRSALDYTVEQFARKEAEDPETHGMATTLTLLHIHEAGATVAHLGDSRIYQVRQGAVIRVSEDHKLVNELIRDGHITAREALTHTQRNVITKVVAADRHDTPEVSIINDVQAGDYFFLCTDGVLEQLYDDLLIYHLRPTDDNTVSDAEKLENIRQECIGKTRDNFTAYLIPVQSAEGEVKPSFKTELPTLKAQTETPVAIPVVSSNGKIQYEEDASTEFTRPSVRSLHPSDINTVPEAPAPEEIRTVSQRPGRRNMVQFVAGIFIGVVVAGGGVWYWMNAEPPNVPAPARKVAITVTPIKENEKKSLQASSSAPALSTQKKGNATVSAASPKEKGITIVESVKHGFSFIKEGEHYYYWEPATSKKVRIIYDDENDKLENIAYRYSFDGKKQSIYLVKPDIVLKDIDRSMLDKDKIEYTSKGVEHTIDPGTGKKLISALDMKNEREKQSADPI